MPKLFEDVYTDALSAAHRRQQLVKDLDCNAFTSGRAAPEKCSRLIDAALDMATAQSAILTAGVRDENARQAVRRSEFDKLGDLGHMPLDILQTQVRRYLAQTVFAIDFSIENTSGQPALVAQ